MHQRLHEFLCRCRPAMTDFNSCLSGPSAVLAGMNNGGIELSLKIENRMKLVYWHDDIFTNFTNHDAFIYGLRIIVLIQMPSCQYTRACLKNHFRDLHSPLCGEFIPNLINAARCAS